MRSALRPPRHDRRIRHRRWASLWLALAIATPLAAAPVEIELSGGTKALRDNIRNHIGSLDDSLLAQPRRLRRNLDRAIHRSAEALGYYRLEYQLQRGDQHLQIALTPGPRLKWLAPQIDVSDGAAAERAIQRRIAGHPFTENRGVSHADYDQFKRDLLQSCVGNGFLDAAYRDSQLLIDVEAGTAQAQLDLDCGVRQLFGEVRYSGSSLDPALVRRIAPIEPGTPFRSRALADLQHDLQRSDYFDTVDVRPVRNGDRVDAEVLLDDAPRHRIGVGIGYGTDTGARSRLRWDRPQLNSAGHSLRSELSWSQPIQELSATYRIPLDRPLQQSVTSRASWESRDVEDTESRIGSLGLFYNDTLWSDDWVYSVGGSYEDESYRQGSDPRQRANYLLPAASISALSIPEGIDPTRGFNSWLHVAGTTTGLGADTPFMRVRLGHKQLLGLGENHLFIARGEVGVINTDDLSLVPSSQRFFTGGDQTVRGYSYESLSPKDDNGRLTGGKYLNVASLEYSYKLLPSWRAALFADSGRAFNQDDEPWHSSVGFGVRWLSPVGQIRADLAFPLDKDEGGFRLHIFMGPPL